jgi:hypothetical protein
VLESRSAYGYYGVAGGVTGETAPANTIRKKMSYWEYKHRYPECDTLNDYDRATKTITVLIPYEYTERPNFGNRYSMSEFRFVYSPKSPGFSDIFECKAKCYKNALRNAKAWAKREGKQIVGDEPGREFQRNL